MLVLIGGSLDSSVNEIVEAIRSLQSNVGKDYIFPITSSLLSAALGAWAAFYAVRVQEKTRLHSQRVESINEILLVASQARNNLIGIKSNYIGKLESNPMQRMLAVPPIIMNSKPLECKISSLSFIAPQKEQMCESRWRRIDYIDSLFRNYDSALTIWNKRNEVLAQVLPQVIDLHGQPISSQQLESKLGRGNIATLSDLTEHALMNTDDVLVELSCFLVGFPEVAVKHVDKRIKKEYKPLSIELPSNPQAIDFLSLVPELDFQMAASIHNLSIDQIKSRYRRIYQH